MNELKYQINKWLIISLLIAFISFVGFFISAAVYHHIVYRLFEYIMVFFGMIALILCVVSTYFSSEIDNAERAVVRLIYPTFVEATFGTPLEPTDEYPVKKGTVITIK
jgi:hypothetical protein